MSFWSRNIDSKGRAIRAIAAAAFFGAAAASLKEGWRIPSLLFGGGGLFCAFESARGWCALRACGVKTRF